MARRGASRSPSARCANLRPSVVPERSIRSAPRRDWHRERQALWRVIRLCRAQHDDFDMPTLDAHHIATAIEETRHDPVQRAHIATVEAPLDGCYVAVSKIEFRTKRRQHVLDRGVVCFECQAIFRARYPCFGKRAGRAD